MPVSVSSAAEGVPVGEAQATDATVRRARESF